MCWRGPGEAGPLAPDRAAVQADAMIPALLLPILLQAAACPATPAPLPPELAGWSTRTAVAATPAGDAVLTIGHGATATLLPAAAVTLAAPVTKPIDPATTSGVFAFTVATAGRYRVALGAGAWVDVVRDGAALPSVAHGHGPACSPVRKMVDYDLTPGRYRLQVVGSATPTLDLLIARLP